MKAEAGNKDQRRAGLRATSAMNRRRPKSKAACFRRLLMCPAAVCEEAPCCSPSLLCVCTRLLRALRQTRDPLLLPAVWWGVQRAAGGPGRVSKEGGENQRAGGEDPSPGVPGKSITEKKRNALKWLCKNRAAAPQRSSKMYVFLPKKEIPKKKNLARQTFPKIIHMRKLQKRFKATRREKKRWNFIFKFENKVEVSRLKSNFWE